LDNTTDNQNSADDPTAAARETAYSQGQASEYDSFRFTKKSGKAIHVAERGCLTRALAKVQPPAHVLEVGCGTGRLLIELEGLGYTVDGADASGAMLAKAKEKFVNSSRQPELMLCGAAELPAQDNTYDFSYTIRLLNQTESPAYALTVVTEIMQAYQAVPNFLLGAIKTADRVTSAMLPRLCSRTYLLVQKKAA